jgi:hypothetical protein
LLLTGLRRVEGHLTSECISTQLTEELHYHSETTVQISMKVEIVEKLTPI